MQENSKKITVKLTEIFIFKAPNEAEAASFAASVSFCYRFRYIFSHLSYYGIVAVRKVALPKI